MRNGILIISHKRPECPTLKTLKKVGYTGEVRIVADDLDETPANIAIPSFTHIRGAQKCLISQDLPRIISDKWKKGGPLDAK